MNTRQGIGVIAKDFICIFYIKLAHNKKPLLVT